MAIKPKPASPRQLVVIAAASRLGDPVSDEFWAGTPGPPFPRHWCGAFALWALREAGVTQASWIVEKGFLYPLRLRQTSSPKPGDIAYFHKYQHHAVVESVASGLLKHNRKDGDRAVGELGSQGGSSRRPGGAAVVTIDGNSGSEPGGRVVRHLRKLNEVTAFFSIESLL